MRLTEAVIDHGRDTAQPDLSLFVIDRIAALADTAAPAFDVDMAQELKLRASDRLPSRAVQRKHMLMLGGSMQPYVWTIDGKVWGDHKPVVARTGERVEIMFHNMSMMGHPMHLHGHVFQVVDRIVVMRRGKIVADAIDPKTTSVEEVERVITGEELVVARG